MAATGAGKSGGRSRSGTSRSRKQAPAQRASGKAKSASEMSPTDEASSRSGQSRARAGSRSASARGTTGRATSRRAGAAKDVSKSASGASASRTSGRTARGAAATRGKDAVAFLKQDHRTVEDLFKQFEEASDGRTRSSIMRKIAQALMVHTQIEEEIFYPAARQEMGDHDLLNEAKVEHDSVKRLIADIENMRPSDQLYKAKVTVLKEYVKHHVKEEERELFPEVKKTGLDLQAMGEELASRHQELMRGGGRGRGRRATAETGLQART